MVISGSGKVGIGTTAPIGGGLDVLDDTKDSIIFVYDDKSYYYFTTTCVTDSIMAPVHRGCGW